MFVTVAFVNAVNLTDGLDGLASGTMLIDSITYAFILFVLAAAAAESGDVYLSDNIKNSMVFAGATAGACLDFCGLTHTPPRIHGDTGSLALGGAFAMLAITSRTLLITPIIGVMFVASAVSVVLQVGSYKLRNKKRVFLMAPLHHHFELKGYPETKIVSMYMIITAIACLIVLLLYV
jgi:phospho-N-acetylmuramoyl-pentapeptide-transferase